MTDRLKIGFIVVMKSIVFVELPRTGLGNKLLLWAKAYTFAQQHGFEIYVKNWFHLPIGTILRREKSKRWYRGYFIQKHRIFNTIRFVYLKLTKQVVIEPLHQESPIESENLLYIFDKVPTPIDYFQFIREQRDSIIDAFYKIVNPKVLAAVELLEAPLIGVHIRRGDFQAEKLVPIEEFMTTIATLRTYLEREVSIVVFTDAQREEILPILAIPNVHLSENQPDLVDLLWLSRSKIIITNAGSTFSYWAGFISDAIILRNQQDLLTPIRPTDFNSLVYEGKLPQGQHSLPDLLVKNLIALKKTL